MMLFMLFALSRLTFSKDTVTATQGGFLPIRNSAWGWR